MKQRIAGKLQSISSRPESSQSGSSKPGPEIETGKDQVKATSYRHALAALQLIIHRDEQPLYDKMAEDFRLRFQPADGFEQELLQRIIDMNWRLTICTSVESGMLANISLDRFDDTSDATYRTFVSRRARTFADQANALGVLGRYEAGLQRRFHSMLKELESAIANRPEPPAEHLAQQTAEPAAKPLVMVAAACSQPEQNTALTPENDLFRSAAESNITGAPRNLTDGIFHPEKTRGLQQTCGEYPL